MSRSIVSLGGSFVRCPQCDGYGYYEIGDVGGVASAQNCPICCTSERDYWAGICGPGWLELPITPQIADHIYDCGNAATMELVYEADLVPLCEGCIPWAACKIHGAPRAEQAR